MARIAYRTDNVPSAGRGAFMPVPARTPSASSAGEERRYLAPWSPTPGPNLQDFNPGPCYDGGGDQGSYANPNGPTGFRAGGAPGAFIPGGPPPATRRMSYWTTPENMGPNGPNLHMKIYSDNVVPVPAGNAGRVAVPAMRTPPFGTIVATAWPRPFISWPTWGSSRQQ